MIFLAIILIWILSQLNAPSWCYVLLLIYACMSVMKNIKEDK